MKFLVAIPLRLVESLYFLLLLWATRDLYQDEGSFR